MALKKRRGQQAVAAEIRRPAAEFHSEIIPVEISLGCSDLPILQATGSCLSVFAVLWVRKQGSERWQEHGRTEVVRSGSAPQFMRSFFLDFLDHDDVLRNEEYLLRTTRVGCLCVCARARVCACVLHVLWPEQVRHVAARGALPAHWYDCRGPGKAEALRLGGDDTARAVPDSHQADAAGSTTFTLQCDQTRRA